eukprot:6214292-Pleurochrysis_carterae.AAC.3
MCVSCTNRTYTQCRRHTAYCRTGRIPEGLSLAVPPLELAPSTASPATVATSEPGSVLLAAAPPSGARADDIGARCEWAAVTWHVTV